MSQSYVKECIFCNQKIRMIEKDGKWSAHNLNNGLHDCRDKDRPTTETKQQFTLEAVIKKLAAVGIIIDVDRLMKGADYIK
jgi:hypothetical protein